MDDHRKQYSPERLYLNGRRMMDDYSVSDAVADYMRLHPGADQERVRSEIEKVAF